MTSIPEKDPKFQGMAKKADDVKENNSPEQKFKDPTIHSVHKLKAPLGMYTMLSADHMDEKSSDRVMDIYNYLKKDKSDFTEGDALMGLRDIQYKLGSPRFGETRLIQVHRYVKLSNQIEELEKKRMALTQ